MAEMNVNDIDALVEQDFTSPVLRALTGVFRRGYTFHPIASESFSEPRLAGVPAGHFRNRKIDDLIKVVLPTQVEGLTTSLVTIERSPNKMVVIRLGNFLLTAGARTAVPYYRRLPKRSKSRLALAKASILKPIQPSLLWETPNLQKNGEDYIFGVLSHCPDGLNKGVLGALDLVIVDQRYDSVKPIDLLEREQRLASLAAEPVAIQPVRIRRRSTES